MLAVNIALESFCIAINIVLIVFLLVKKDNTHGLRLCFLGMLVSNILTIWGDLSDWLFAGINTPFSNFIVVSGAVIMYLGTTFMLIFFEQYISLFLQPGVKVHKAFHIVTLSISAIQILFAFLSVFNGMYFFLTPEGRYARGSLFLLAQALPFILFALCGAIVITYRKHLSFKDGALFLCYVTFPLVAEIVQIFAYGLAMVTVSVTFLMLIIFINIQINQAYLVEKQEKELTQMRVDIMMSQIQPHFLYNTLTAIRHLCDVDTEQAKDAITEFAQYLRANMNSISAKGPIPFEQELNHAQNYLSLEKRRFGKRLNIVYDIGCTNFKLPPLSIQALAENAVRHGICKKPEGGTIRIISEEMNNGFLVTISDNGIGFDINESNNDNRLHIGIENVKQRISEQCCGSVTVDSAKDSGTTVKLFLPKEFCT